MSSVNFFSRYKINLQKNQLHLYTLTTNHLTKKTIPFTISSKRIKYLGINLTEEVKDLCADKYKTWVKETEEDTKKWMVHVHGGKELTLSICSYYTKLSTDNVISNKSLMEF